MGKLYVDFDDTVPRIVCTFCFNCTSIMGKNLCGTANRGCCWYFPKFNLLDIQRMSKSEDGLATLEFIRKSPGSIVYRYYIHSKGKFYDKEYNDYLKNSFDESADKVDDSTIFFRTCPFVKEGEGCTLPPRFRSHVCNFFVCSEIEVEADAGGLYSKYLNERSKYSRWIHWENFSLEYALSENNIDLIKDFDKCIEFLKELPLNEYEFPQLEPIDLSIHIYKDVI